MMLHVIVLTLVTLRPLTSPFIIPQQQICRAATDNDEGDGHLWAFYSRNWYLDECT